VAGFLAGVGTAGTGFGVLIGTVSRATPPEKRAARHRPGRCGGIARTMVLGAIASR